jgi:iron complex outermembrane receptor protein
MIIKNKLLCGATALSATIFSGLLATHVYAATAQTDTTATSEATVGELVVTAEKREEKIETVPVAISAYGAHDRDLLGIQTTQQLSDFTPGLSYFSADDRAYIRGIGRNTVNLATESGVATYYNGVYYGANASIAEAHDSLFIGTVEVDRGPQNTLHGSNADGGTISYVSQKPTNSFYAEGRVGVQDYGEYYGEAVVSGPLSDNVRFRVGGNYTSETGGYFNNLDGPREGGNLEQGNNGTSGYFEAQLDANIGDHLDAWAMASTGDYKTSFHTASTIGPINNYEFFATSLAPSDFFGLCGLPGQGSKVGCAGQPGWAGQTIVPGSVVTDPVVASQFPGNNPSNVNIRDFIQTIPNSNNQRDDVALATHWTYHLPSMDVEYIGGYQTFNYHLITGTGADAGVTQYQLQGPVGFGNLTINPSDNHIDFNEIEQYFSHELNLSSTGSGPVQWIGGVYWYHEHYDQPVSAGCEPFQTQLQAPLTLLGAAAPANPSSCPFEEDAQLQYDSVAAYGQFTWQISDQFKFEGAARYTADHKYGYEAFRIIAFDDPFLGVPTVNTLGAFTPAIDITPLAIATGKYAGAGLPVLDAATGQETRALNANWGAWTGEANLTWQPSSDTLAYAKYSRGYKTGGFNAGTVAANPITAPEYVDAYEIGLKQTLSSTFQLNASAFYYNYQNDQQPLNVQIPGTTVTTSFIFNIPSVHTYGVELEGIWRPIDPLTFRAEYSYLSSKVASTGGLCFSDPENPGATLAGSKTAGCPAGSGLQTLLGNSLPETPPNKIALNAAYTFTFDPGKLILSASFIWKDATYGEIFNYSMDRAPAYSVVNLRAEWDDAKDRYNASLFVNNIGNTNGYDIFTETDLGGGDYVTSKGLINPLTFGGEIQFRFR